MNNNVKMIGVQDFITRTGHRDINQDLNKYLYRPSRQVVKVNWAWTTLQEEIEKDRIETTTTELYMALGLVTSVGQRLFVHEKS